LVIQLSGELDTSGADSVDRLLNVQLSRPLCRVVLDVGALTQLSGDGIELLVGLHRRARIEGFVLLLVGLANRAAERPLRLAGALPLFTTRPTLEHALAGVIPRG
jgi:anti-anti-sigma factor